MKKRNIVITGFMGVGKSSIGSVLAKRMKMPFVDMDEIIEKREGKNIKKIFLDHGEDFFRKLEYALCCELSERSGFVISTGGGTLISKKNRDLFRKSTIFCLQAPFYVIQNRLSKGNHHNHRPLINTVRELWLERKPTYDKIFHQIHTDKYSTRLLINKMIKLYQLDHYFKCIDKDFYPIILKRGITNKIASFLEWSSLNNRKICIITHAELNHLNHFWDKLRNVLVLTLPPGEGSKNLSFVKGLYEQLLINNFTRDDILIAFGGGVIGDVAGFVAGTFLRGMHFVQIPTTLLAMVDSCVGGKSGINTNEGKNIIGVLKNPIGILIDPNILKTLPEREKRSGLAEIVKHAIIADLELFEYLESGLMDFLWIINRAIQVKIKIIKEDFYEQDRRMCLNFGHTFGHAIELASNYKIKHGEAVSIGMVQAAKYAAKRNICSFKLVARIENLLTKLALPTELPHEITNEHLLHFIQYDKKRFGSKIYLIVPIKIGEVQRIEIDLDSENLQTIF